MLGDIDGMSRFAADSCCDIENVLSQQGQSWSSSTRCIQPYPGRDAPASCLRTSSAAHFGPHEQASPGCRSALRQ